MKKELQNLSSQLRRLGFNSYASKVKNMFNHDRIEERDALDRIDDLDEVSFYDEKEERALQRERDRREEKLRTRKPRPQGMEYAEEIDQRIEDRIDKAMKSYEDEYPEIKNNEPDMSESTYRFENLEDDVDSSLMNSQDDEHDGDYKQFFYDERDNGSLSPFEKDVNSSKLEGKELRSGLLNLVRKALPPKGEVTGNGDTYNVDIKSYINFLGKELSIEMPGIVSMSGEAQINVQDLSDEIMKIYSKMSEAKKVNFISKVARLIRR
jgi:hypothetical protein